MIIKHQMQPTPITCFCTSVAMMTNLPADDVIATYHDDYYSCKLSTSAILDALGVPYTWFRSVDNPSIDADGAYLLTVPSLNIQAGTHAVVVELHDGDWCVHDPVKGREGKKYYTSTVPTHEFEVMLRSWVMDAFVPMDYIHQRYSVSL